jgi:hypothetical protein
MHAAIVPFIAFVSGFCSGAIVVDLLRGVRR